MTNHILIDYENVQPGALSTLDATRNRVYVFVGAAQPRVNFEVVEALQRLGSSGTYIKISGTGSNALDFHIAYFMGKIASEDKEGRFYVISKDRGFDPLVEYLKSNKRCAARLKSVLDIPVAGSGLAQTTEEQITVLVQNLKQRGKSRPRKVDTLRGTINNLFRNSLSDTQVNNLVNMMISNGQITTSKGHVTYRFD